MINNLKSFVLGSIILTLSLVFVGAGIWLYQWIMSQMLGRQIFGYGLLGIIAIGFIYISYRLGESIREEF